MTYKERKQLEKSLVTIVDRSFEWVYGQLMPYKTINSILETTERESFKETVGITVEQFGHLVNDGAIIQGIYELKLDFINTQKRDACRKASDKILKQIIKRTEQN